MRCVKGRLTLATGSPGSVVEAIADATDRHQAGRVIRQRLDLRAQPAHVDVHGPRAAGMARPPDEVQQLAARVGAARVRREQREQAELLGPQVDDLAMAPELVRRQVDLEPVADRQDDREPGRARANAFATGDVTGAAGTSGFTTLGGLAGVNLGSVSNSFASGDVGSPNVANLQAGGLIGNNSGTILSSTALGNVQTGDTSIAGGLVAVNSVGGAITSSQASGNVTVGTGSVAGSLVGANNGTISTRLYRFGHGHGHWHWYWHWHWHWHWHWRHSIQPAVTLAVDTAAAFSLASRGEQLAAQQTQQTLNLTSTLQLAALNTAPVFTTTQGGIRLPPQQAPGPAPGTGTGPAAGNQFLPPGIDRRIIDIPPPNETRLKTDEVMVQIRTDIGVERLRAAVANLGVSN